jgi:hypothetical protein
MKFATIVSAVFGAVAVDANPGLTFAKRQYSNSTCLTQSDADDIVSRFLTVMLHFDMAKANATAQELFADDFSETSDSINTLGGNPVSILRHTGAILTILQLGAISFPTKQNYVSTILAARAPLNISSINIMPAGCSNVLWQWNMLVAQNIMPVKGFNLMVINGNGQMQTQYVEFNSIAWATDIGECEKGRGRHQLMFA